MAVGGREMTAYEFLEQEISKPLPDTCMIWPYQIDRDGYGRLSIPKVLSGKKLKVAAHRLAFVIAYGKAPMPLGLHTCDNPSCFNPKHITAGTHSKNQAEKAERGRSIRGVQQHDAKLSDEIVGVARREYASGESSQVLANRYGVTPTAMRWAIRGKTWKHLTGAVKLRPSGTPFLFYCKRGHLLSEDNVYRYGKARQCKACTSLRSQKEA
jgi:hypothetical protein